MKTTKDGYWDDLGVAWSAIGLEPQIVAPRLKARLKAQSMLIGALALGGIPLALLGLVLGGWTIWLGWSGHQVHFVTRGTAVIAISAMLAFATWSLGARLKDDTRSLAQMTELALARALRTLTAIRLGYVSCAIAALFGMVGSWIRSHAGDPPAMSPVEPLVVLALVVVALAAMHRITAGEAAKYAHLKLLLTEGD